MLELFLGQVPIPNKRHKKAMSERCLDRKRNMLHDETQEVCGDLRARALVCVQLNRNV